jgi:hypothetical protein
MPSTANTSSIFNAQQFGQRHIFPASTKPAQWWLDVNYAEIIEVQNAEQFTAQQAG